MTTFTRHRAIADRLLSSYGGAAVLTQKVTTTTGGNAWDNANAGTTDVIYDVTIVQTGNLAALEDKTLVQTGDVLGVMAVPGTTPKAGDKLAIDGTPYNLIEVRPIAPAGIADVVCFEFQARA